MATNISRYIEMLKHIKTYPAKVTTAELTEKLNSRGYFVDLRTVQRDLNDLLDEGQFGLEVDKRNKPFGWSISSCWNKLKLTMMDQHMALAFYTLKHNASQLLPPQSITQLTPYFDSADRVLGQNSDSPWLFWACRVAQLPQPFPIIYQEQDPQALAIIQEALLHQKQVACQIQRAIGNTSHWFDYDPINPQGIRVLNGVPLLIFTVATALHSKRYAKPIDMLRNVRLLNSKIELHQPNLSLPEKPKAMIDLELIFAPSATFILRNAKFSHQQTTTRLPSGDFLVKARVEDSENLRSYLWGMVDKVEVIAPAKLRGHFKRKIDKMTQRYQSSTTRTVAIAS
ncbi:helix-turn-helix transcriptional regulator [Shewanella maritima]|uniref:helix-turn-helix transcriptional regulator n=1 Tax=Shewanella maritima TaxID=2520507 RepID=UPI0037351290